jgi:hypothetical protein
MMFFSSAIQAFGTASCDLAVACVIRGSLADERADEASVPARHGCDPIDGTFMDEIIGPYGGNDTLRSFGSNDLIFAGVGQDGMDGGLGADTVYESAASGGCPAATSPTRWSAPVPAAPSSPARSMAS